MVINKLIGLFVGADLSALGGCSDIPIKKLIYIIAPCVTLSIAQLKHLTGAMQTTFTTAFTSVLMTVRSHYDICCFWYVVIRRNRLERRRVKYGKKLSKNPV
jgi:hypothetical protein